ncbi:MAG TPA: peptidoglycan DD-metalloendopeptidase family protein [Alphaproteobacteria bacterium]|nr:peptidoglycan DD-metalloendopeptidase family protein [Alphaproteobacteria bacterium]
MANEGRNLHGFLCAMIVAALLSACGDPSEESTPGRQSWPEGYVVPIPGSTFPLAATNLPGAAREYRSSAQRGFEFFNGVSGRLLSSDEPVVAVADGEIIRIDHAYGASGEDELYFYAELSDSMGFLGDYARDKLRGRQVWIRHETGHISRYAHLSKVHPELEPGAAVMQGQPIGLMGNTGIPPTGDQPSPLPRLHFELWLPDGSRYLGEGMAPLQSHVAVASVFSAIALPRYARRVVSQAQAGQEISTPYPPEDLPDIEFQVDPPRALPAGNAFAIPITWEDEDLSVQDFSASLEGRSLGLIDAGNGAWILGAIPLQSTGDALNLSVGTIDAFGRTIAGQSPLQITAPAIASEAREVEPAVLELYTERNQRIEAAKLAPIHRQSLGLREPLWSAPFQPPTAGKIVATFGQLAVHGVRRPEYPLPGIEIVPADQDAEIGAANTGIVALVDELPIRGKTVALIHGGGVVTIYSQLDQIRVSVGEQVERGQALATMHTESPDSGAVQVEIHVAGSPSNPVGWLNQMLPVAAADSAE